MCAEQEPIRVRRARDGSRAQSTRRLVRAATYLFVRQRAKKATSAVDFSRQVFAGNFLLASCSSRNAREAMGRGSAGSVLAVRRGLVPLRPHGPENPMSGPPEGSKNPVLYTCPEQRHHTNTEGGRR